MKRLNRRNRENHTTSEPAANTATMEAPEAESMEDKETETLTETTNEPQLPAFAGNSYLAALGAYTKHDAIDYQESTGAVFHFLKFYSANANDAPDARLALGKGITEGHPYIKAKDTYIDASKFKFMVLAEMPYWATLGANHAPDRAWLQAQPKTKTFMLGKNVQEIKENINALLLAFSPEGEVYAVMCEARTTKCPFVKDILRGVDRTVNPETDEDKEFVRSLGSIAGRVPPRYRVTGTAKILPRTGGDFPYALARADLSAVTIAELEALNEWGQDEECQAELEAITNLFTKKTKEIEALAKATKD